VSSANLAVAWSLTVFLFTRASLADPAPGPREQPRRG